jgi:hypothetical protein
MVRLLIVALFLPACGKAALLMGPDPGAAARTYLNAAAKPGEPDLAALVDSRCKDKPIARGAPVRFLGIPMTLDKVELNVEKHLPDFAIVAFDVTGSVKAKKTKTKTKLLGKQFELSVSDLSVNELNMSGKLILRRYEGGPWLVSCDPR